MCSGTKMAFITRFFPLFFLLILNSVVNVYGQCTPQSFQLAFGGTSGDIAYDVADAGNGQFFVAGTTLSFGAGGLDILITKMSATGSIIWSQVYGATGNETVRKISATPDSGLLVTGQTTSFNSQGDIFCMKIDAKGNLLWSRRFGVSADINGDLGLDIIQTADGGYAFTGIFNVAGSIANLAMAKLDANANIVWCKRLFGQQASDGTGIIQDGNNLIVTTDLDHLGTNYSSLIMRVNIMDGTIITQTQIVPGARGLFQPYLTKDINNNGYWISGQTIDGYSYAAMQATVLKLDNNFNITNTYSYKVPGVYTNDFYSGFAQTGNGFIACASTTSSPTTGYLFNINSDGSVRWSKNFMGNKNRSLYKLRHIGSEIITVGRDNSSGNGGDDFFVAGFSDGGYVDSLCHPDTAQVAITNPAFSGSTFTWTSITDQTFANTSAPISVSTVSLSPRSMCDACPVPAITPAFTIPDTVCVNAPVNITNKTVGASTYYWSFCTADVNQPPVGTNLGNIGNTFGIPVFMDYALVNGNYYGFMVNNGPGGLVRLDFGSNLLNTPTATNLGNFGGIIPNSAQGIQLVQNNGNWYAIIVGGDPNIGVSSRVLKVEFGTDLTNNAPTATNWGNVGNLDYPTDVYVFKSASNWYGFTVNIWSNTITQFNFGADFSAQPTGVNLGNLGNLDGPSGIFTINDNGTWRLFVANFNSNTLSRIDFGNSLLNAPSSSVNLGNPGGLLNTPRDIYIFNYCGGTVGFVVNDVTGDMVRLNFSNLSSIPAAASLGVIGGATNPHSISRVARVGSDLVAFLPNSYTNTLSRVQFKGCTSSSIPNSSLQNPPAVSYSAPGIYNINLDVDDGLATQNSVCQQVVVAGNPNITLSNDTSVCKGDSIRLIASGGTSYQWSSSGGISNPADSNILAVPAVTTTYFVNVKNSTGCASVDSVKVLVLPLPVIAATADTAICSGANVQLSAAAVNGKSYSWSPSAGLNDSVISNPVASPAITTIYYVQVTGSNTCTSKDSVTVTILQQPTAKTIADTAICSGTSIALTTTAVNGSTYSWLPVTGLSNPAAESPVAMPTATMQYIVTVNPGSQCFAKDTVNITVNPAPTVKASGDTAICSGGSGQLTAAATGNVTYNWYPTNGLSNPGVFNPVASPSSTTQYFIIVAAGQCTAKDSLTVTVTPYPIITTIADTTIIICRYSSIQLVTTAVNGNTYSWSPAAGLSDSTVLSPVASPLADTKYILTVNPGKCSAKDSVSISLKPTPSVTAFGDTSICSGSTVNLSSTASPGVTYNWSPATGLTGPSMANPVASPLTSTVYYVQVEYSDNCTAKDSVTINVTPQPMVKSIGDTAICSGAAIQLATTAVNGNTYSWYPATGLSNAALISPVASPSATTRYILTVNAGTLCTATDTVTVTVNPTPTVKASGDTAICSGGSGRLMATATGNVSYSWYPTTGLSDPSIYNPLASPSSTTGYFITVTTVNQCSAKDSITLSVLPQPTVKGIGDTAICSGTTIQLTTTAVNGNTYSWSPATGLSNAAVESPGASPSVTTQYILTVNPGALCIAVDTVTVTVNPLPVLAVSNDTIICSGGSAQLEASTPGNVTYNWVPSRGLSGTSVPNPLASPALTTNYNITVTDNHKCVSLDSVLVTVTPQPVFGISPSSAGICIGENVSVTASGGDVYQWFPSAGVANPSAPSTAVSPVVTTTYQVYITSNTCKITDTLQTIITVTTRPDITVSKSNDIDCFTGQATLQATGGGEYSWSPTTGLNNPYSSSPVASPLQTTTYYVTVSKGAGCTATDSIQLKVLTDVQNGYYLASAFTPNGDGYNDCFGVKLWGGIKTIDFSVFNRWGIRIFHTNNPSECWDGTYNGQPQPPGTFVYQIEANTICGPVYRKGTVVLVR